MFEELRPHHPVKSMNQATNDGPLHSSTPALGQAQVAAVVKSSGSCLQLRPLKVVQVVLHCTAEIASTP